MTNTAGQNDIIVIGSLNRDYTIETTARPAPGETVTGARLSISSGGKGANQAAAAARLGATVRLIGRIGDDDAGQELVAALRGSGVDTTSVIVSPSTASGAAFITVTPDGENAIVVASGANALLDRHDLQAKAPLLATARIMLLQLEISDEAIETALQLAGNETLVVLNSAPYRGLDRAVLERVDILVANEVETRQFLGDDVSLDDAAAFARLGPRATVVTLGDVGARAFVENQVFQQAALHRKVVDTTGAGDAFVGALGAWLVREPMRRSDSLSEPLVRALSAASVAAAYSVQRIGAQSSYAASEELGAPWN